MLYFPLSKRMTYNYEVCCGKEGALSKRMTYKLCCGKEGAFSKRMTYELCCGKEGAL